MSPEQAAGKQSIVDHRTDIYSLGVTLYRLLTLKLPFDGDDRSEILSRIAAGNPKPLRLWDSSIPRDLQTIVLKSIANEPNDRYATAAELADDLGRFLNSEPVRAKPPGTWKKVWAGIKRNPRMTAAIMLAAALTCVAVIFALQLSQASSLAAVRDSHLKLGTYANDMQAALAAIDAGRPGKAQTILLKHAADSSSDDLRDFEWYCLWQMTTSELAAFGHSSGQEKFLAISPDGRYVAAGGPKITVWDTVTGQLVCQFEDCEGVSSLEILQDNDTLIAVDGTLKFYSITQKSLIYEFEKPHSTLRSFALNADETMLATTCKNRQTNQICFQLWAFAKTESGFQFKSGICVREIEGIGVIVVCSTKVTIHGTSPWHLRERD